MKAIPKPDILIDLDGTITDPARGIIGSCQYALRKLGAPIPEYNALAWIIGPPLRQSFARLLAPGGDAEEALRLYREVYAAGGLRDADVYPGVPQALVELRGIANRIFVCTAKPTVFARQVLEHFGLDGHFDRIYGPELDGRLDDKAELMAHMIKVERITPQSSVMIGDRDNDIRAAKANGMPSIGVLWGYGGREELVTAGATVLCERPGQLVQAARDLLIRL
jgi:phosphoglycolate phosphatase